MSRIESAMHARDTAGLVLPAHTMKSEARQFGAELLGALAEEIEFGARRAIEMGFFPDNLLPSVARLRPLYDETIDPARDGGQSARRAAAPAELEFARPRNLRIAASAERRRGPASATAIRAGP